MKLPSPGIWLHMAALVALAFPAAAGEAEPRKLPAFPGAEGFGSETSGGRGGKVIRVTNLNPSGPGSLQAACDVGGPRIVVFEVSGIIRGNVQINRGQITVAGQTAPGGGITIEGRFTTRYRPPEPITDVVVRFVRVRPPSAQAQGVRGSGHDAITMSPTRLVLDHISCSWATDETIDIYEGKDVTVQWCTITESDVVGHEKGRHNYGLISGPRGERVSIHKCLFAHHSRRNPAIANGPADFRNNVVYNFNHGFSHEGHPPNGKWYNIVANYYKKGPSAPRVFIVGTIRGRSYYIAENFIEGIGKIGDPRDPKARFPSWIQLNRLGGILTEPVKVAPVKTVTAEEAYGLVLAKAGCHPRDAVTKRIIDEAKKGTGSWGRHSQADLWEGLERARPWADSDSDGMPDGWERAHGLNTSGDDHNKAMPSGYTVVEEYCNQMAAWRIAGSPEGKCPAEGSLEFSPLKRKEAGTVSGRRPPKAARATAPAPRRKPDPERAAASRRALIEIAVKRVSGGFHPRAYVSFFGRTRRTRIVSATAEAFTAQASGIDQSVKWAELEPDKFCGIVSRCIDPRNASHQFELAKFCAAAVLEADFIRAVGILERLDAGLAKRARSLPLGIESE